MPKTRLGKWSVGFIIAFFLLFAIFLLFAVSGQLGGDTFTILSAPAILLLLAGICGISSFFTGVVSIIKNKERSVLVLLATAIGFYVLFFALGESLSVVGILPQH